MSSPQLSSSATMRESTFQYPSHAGLHLLAVSTDVSTEKPPRLLPHLNYCGAESESHPTASAIGDRFKRLPRYPGDRHKPTRPQKTNRHYVFEPGTRLGWSLLPPHQFHSRKARPQ